METTIISKRLIGSTMIKYIFDPFIKTLTFVAVNMYSGALETQIKYQYNDGNIEMIECFGAYADMFKKTTINGKLLEMEDYLNNFGDSEESLKDMLVALVSLIQRDDK